MLWLRLKKRLYLRHLRRKTWPVPVKEYLRGLIGFDFERPLAKTEFVVLDTETTGFNVKEGHRIVSISAVRLKEGRIDLADVFHSLVNPARDIPPEAAVVHEILPRMVEGKPLLEKVLPDFIRYIGPAVLVGHHVWLDLSFLNWGMARLFGFSLQNMVLDTALLDQALTPGKIPTPGRRPSGRAGSLNTLAERYRVIAEEDHSSFGDALTTAQIFQVMIKRAERVGLLSLQDLLRLAYTPPSFRISPLAAP